MQITVPLTLTLEVKDQAEADKYLDSASGEVSPDWLADIYDEQLIESITYSDTSVVSICDKTQQQIREILSARIP